MPDTNALNKGIRQRQGWAESHRLHNFLSFLSKNININYLMCVPFEIASFLQLEFLRGRFATTG